MYPETKTFWLEQTDQVAVGLRRYSHRSEDATWDCAGGYHDALVYIGRAASVLTERKTLAPQPRLPRDDPRWPTRCSRCLYVFTATDEWQNWQEQIYVTHDGREFVLHTRAGADSIGVPSAPPGATWNAWWMDYNVQPDGICLMVRCPNGSDWMVDSEASNCTRKGEPHQCWVRHGDPRLEHVTVDKDSPNTCTAGAGSIQADDYHGFLRDGVLTAG